MRAGSRDPARADGTMTALITVISPVGPAHHEHIKVAHASLHTQTVPRAWWHHIVVRDTGGCGPAVARNCGLAAAQTPFVLFLDADDYLHPTAMATLLRAYATTRAAYVYGDNYVRFSNGQMSYEPSERYQQAHLARYNIHVVTALVATADAHAVGGFDEAIDAWEDWTLWLRLAIAGRCGDRVPAPVLTYQIEAGSRFRMSNAQGQAAMDAVVRRYQNSKGVIGMCGCGGPNPQAQAAARGVLGQLAPVVDDDDPVVRMEYVGEMGGTFWVKGTATGTRYKTGGRKLVDVQRADVPQFLAMGDHRVLAPIAPPAPPPAPMELVDAEVLTTGSLDVLRVPEEIGS